MAQLTGVERYPDAAMPSCGSLVGPCSRETPDPVLAENVGLRTTDKTSSTSEAHRRYPDCRVLSDRAVGRTANCLASKRRSFASEKTVLCEACGRVGGLQGLAYSCRVVFLRCRCRSAARK